MLDNKHTKLKYSIAIFAIAFLIFVSLAFTAVLVYNNQQLPDQPVCRMQIPDVPNQNLSESAQRGNRQFNSYCAACHKLDARSTGPALGNTKPEVFWKWIDTTAVTANVSNFENFGIEYHNTFFKEHLDPSQLNDILEYIDK